MSATCHPERPILAKNLCGTCYNKRKREESSTVMDKYRAAYKKYALINREHRRAKAKERYHSQTEHVKSINLKSKYGLTSYDLKVILEKQSNLCKLCNLKKTLVIDHCHKTGVVRGLLCTSCNTALGKFKDDPDLLEKAIRYLNESRVF